MKLLAPVETKIKNMIKLALHWEFFKSTLVLNLSSSVLLSFIVYIALKNFPDQQPPLYIVYIRCCMFGGSLLCLFSKKYREKMNTISIIIGEF